MAEHIGMPFEEAKKVLQDPLSQAFKTFWDKTAIDNKNAYLPVVDLTQNGLHDYLKSLIKERTKRKDDDSEEEFSVEYSRSVSKQELNITQIRGHLIPYPLIRDYSFTSPEHKILPYEVFQLSLIHI
eukprot:TRINITY_DN10533_c0_g1_i2.p1 TRINITY_DN10533_c0_g1~~TRINITY_DN10533_c0_g1_i2.p1  ORF type:complete len:127 (+),score=21.54 TRINITY_DN10533_c0_g1_i2:59-439(+)